MEVSFKNFARTSAYAIVAQCVSLVSGLFMTILLPKFTSIEDYGYWQLFLLYASYVGMFLLGYADGIYLQIGGKDFNSLNKEKIANQFFLVLLLQLIWCAIIITLALTCINAGIRRTIFILIAIYVPIENLYRSLSFVQSATDKLINNSRIVIIEKILLIIFVISIITGIVQSYAVTIMVGYIAVHLIGFFCLSIGFLPFFKSLNINKLTSSVKEVGKCMKVGIFLTFSNIIANLILGSGRFFADYYWNIKIFAQISFAVVISMFVLTFISQIGLVLFPFLRNMSTDKQYIVYNRSLELLKLFSLLSLFMFFIIYAIIYYYLPAYHNSLTFLAVLFPISFYEIRTSIVFTTFLKSFLLQKELLIVNIVTLSVSLILYYISCKSNIYLLMPISMLTAITVRSLILQKILDKKMNVNKNAQLISEIGFWIIVIGAYLQSGMTLMFLVYTLGVAIIFFIQKKEVKENISFIINRIK